MKKLCDLLKRTFELYAEMQWVKKIDRECDKYNKLKEKLERKRYVINGLVKEFEKIYGIDFLKGDHNHD